MGSVGFILALPKTIYSTFSWTCLAIGNAAAKFSFGRAHPAHVKRPLLVVRGYCTAFSVLLPRRARSDEIRSICAEAGGEKEELMALACGLL